MLKEFCQRTEHKAPILPYFAFWEDDVSNENGKIRKILGLSKQVYAYIQQVVMYQTVDTHCCKFSDKSNH